MNVHWFGKQYWQILIPFGLSILAVVLRLQGIGSTPISQDESSIIRYAQEGVLERGYPFLWRAGKEFIMATYELIPYPVAGAIYWLGFSEFSVRLPALCFGVGTTLLIFYFGSYLFDRRVGLLASLIYAILPWSIYWGNNCFYPSQLQFFVLLTTMTVHHLIYHQKVATYSYYLISLTFILTYFSWEVSGILLPIFFLIGLMLRWGHWTWLANYHFWNALSLVVIAVGTQLYHRTILRAPFEKLGSSLADVSFFQLASNRIDYDPLFYLDIFVSADVHIMLIGFILVGVFFLRTNWNLRFIYLLIVLSQIFLTTFIGLYALRYAYFLLPFIVIAASAATFLSMDSLVSRLKPMRSVKIFNAIGTALLCGSHLAFASSDGLHLEGLFPWLNNYHFELQYNSRGSSFRSISNKLQEHYHSGDIVVIQAPSPTIVYTDIKTDYFLQSIVMSAVFAKPEHSHYFVDKWVGNPVLRTLEDLQDVLYGHSRVWIVLTPFRRGIERVTDDIQYFITHKASLIAESTKGRLYLWENPAFIRQNKVQLN